ncbi:hypothetical protein GCM10009647_085320 [Streptomyces sanglieri]
MNALSEEDKPSGGFTSRSSHRWWKPPPESPGPEPSGSGVPVVQLRWIRPRLTVTRQPASGCVVAVSFDGGEPVLEAVAGAVDGDDVAVVEEAVEDGGGEAFVTERLSPFAEGFVRGQGDREEIGTLRGDPSLAT